MKKILFAILACCISLNAYALTKGFSANSFIPVVDRSPYFTLYGSDTLKYGEFAEGSSITYAYRSFQLTQGGSRQQGILDHEFIQNFSFALGLPDDHIQAGILVPVAWALNYKDPSVTGANGQNKMALGDISLSFKTNFLSLTNHKFGLGLFPFMTIPTGRGQYYFGNGTFSGGGKIILEFKPIERLSLTFNPGVLIRNKFEFASIEYANQILLNAGASYRVTDDLTVNAEILNSVRLSAPFKHKYESPTEALAGIRWNAGKGFAINAGAGGGIIYGSYVPLFRGFAGFSYAPPARIIGIVE